MRAYFFVSGVIFATVALVHVIRLWLGWHAELAGREVPIWVSWIAIFVSGALCAWAFRLALQKKE